MVTSRYIQLCDWLLLEYTYTANAPDNLSYRTTPGAPGEDYIGVYKIDNIYTGEYQFVNKGNPISGSHLTGNCLDWSASPVDEKQTRWALTNVSGSGRNPFTSPSELILTDLSTIIPRVSYDTVKLHILSGYNFEGLDGFVLEVFFKENSKKNFKAATFCFSTDLTTQKFELNANPIFLGEKLYDKYLEFNVPALNQIQDEYWRNTGLVTGFAYNYSHPTVVENPNPGGYVKDSPIFFKLHELVNVETVDSIDYFDEKQLHTASILPVDSFSSLGCTVKESDDGDYFEYYPTWQNGFIDTYISNLNSSGDNDWSVINELRVIEQIGTTLKQTAQIVQFQDEGFDTPNYYRPIIQNAANAFSFTLHYIMKFFNRATSEQITRVATLTSHEPKKYGLGLTKINIEENIKPINVYNKVINLKRLSSNMPASKPMNVTTRYVNIYVDRYNVAINADSNEVKDDGTVFYGQGELTIYLSKFDNVIKFKLVKLSQGEYIPIDITNCNIYMNFILDNEQTISIAAEKPQPEKGEGLVKIPRATAQRLLKQKKDTSFYIVGQYGDESLETLIYTGKYKNASNTSDDLFEVKKPILDYIKDKEESQTAQAQVLAQETQSLENAKTNLSIKSRNLKKQLEALKKVISSLPASLQAQFLNELPDSIDTVDAPQLDAGNAQVATGLGASSSNDQPIVEENSSGISNVNPTGGDNTTTNTTGGQDNNQDSSGGKILKCGG